MPQTLDSAVLEDAQAVSLARALTAANHRARQEGVEPEQRLISAVEHADRGKGCWRISYGPRDYVLRRGGDLVIDVDFDDGQIRRVLRGQ